MVEFLAFIVLGFVSIGAWRVGKAAELTASVLAGEVNRLQQELSELKASLALTAKASEDGAAPPAPASEASAAVQEVIPGTSEPIIVPSIASDGDTETRKLASVPKIIRGAEKAAMAQPLENSSPQAQPDLDAGNAPIALIEPLQPHPIPADISLKAMPDIAVKKGDIEQTVATRWTVWVGGIALGVGGLMIVRYSIEAGVFGPGVRLAMGATFAALLAGMSEFVRRRDLRIPVGQFPSDQIPTVLAGVSVLSAFGVIYAAHAIYGFVGAPLAFGGMGAVGLAALGASLLHGKWFGLFGLLGSYLTPILVSSAAPNFMALSIFICVVTITAVLLHRRRPALPVLIGALAGHGLWTLLIALANGGPLWSATLIIVASMLATYLAETGENSEVKPSTPGFRVLEDPEVAAGMAAFAIPVVLGGVIWVLNGGGNLYAAALVFVVGAAIIAAIRHRDFTLLAPLAGAGSIGMILLWPLKDAVYGISPRLLIDVLSLRVGQGNAPGLVLFSLAFALVVCGLISGALLRRWRNAGGQAIERGLLAFTAALVPVGLMLATSLRLNGFERTSPFAVIAMGLMIGLATLSEFLFRQEKATLPGVRPSTEPMSFIVSAGFATGGAIALGLAIAFAFRETWLVVGFAVASCAVALLTLSRPIPLLRSISSALASAALARVLWQPFLTDLGNLPVLNWLLVVYGLPALAFAIGAWALSERQDRALGMLEALAAGFFAVLVLLEVLQAFLGADVTRLGEWINAARAADNLAGIGSRLTGLIAMLSVAFALLSAFYFSITRATRSPVIAGAETAATLLLVGLVLGGLAIILNPLLMGSLVREPPILNRLLFGYVGLAVIFALLRRMLPDADKDALLANCLDALSLVMGVLGVTLVLRHCFSGPQLHPVTGASIGYFESVSMILLWSLAAGVIALWHRRYPSPIFERAFEIICFGTLAYAALMLGFFRNPFFQISEVAGPILFNRITWGYAPVVIAFFALSRLALSGWRVLARALLGGGAVAAALMLFLLVRHGFHGATLHSTVPLTLAETGIYTSIILAVAFGLLLRETMVTPPNSDEALVISGMAVLASAGLFAACAYGGADIVGWPLINNALVGILLPSALAAMLALWVRNAGFKIIVSRLWGLAAVPGGLAYVLLQVRFLFPEADWTDAWTSPAHRFRLFGYSIAMISYGIALLVAGFRMADRDLRVAALGVVALSAAKVFLLDMSGLEGLWRAFSFIGLGGSLIGIAYLYRRMNAPNHQASPRRD